jgi:hypothetical protein
MPIYNFKSQFAAAVRSGTKTQTIRARGKRRPPEPGQIAHCYTGLRTKQVCRLGDFEISTVTPISISAAIRTVQIPAGAAWRQLYDEELESLARADGFATVDEFFEFFQSEHGGTFGGFLIQWQTKGAA